MVDVFEVANDSNRTLVAGATGHTWRVRLPDAAREPNGGGGDLPPEAFRFADGNAELVVPFPPGSRQLVMQYAVPAGSRVDIPIADAVSTLEVLLEGRGATVSGAGLAIEDTVTFEGRSFQRYTAQQVAAGASFDVRSAGGGNAGKLALLAVAAIAIALGIVVGRRGLGAAAPPAAPRTTTETLAREIAALDHVYAAPAKQAGEGGDYYRERRGALVSRLVEAQAVEDRETSA